MTFAFKLSQRLARMRSATVILTMAAFAACEQPISITDIGNYIIQMGVVPHAVTLLPSQNFQVVAFGRTAAGDSASVTVKWVSSNPAVANVSGTGLVTATGEPGTATIIATSEGLSASSTVTVAPTSTVTPGKGPSLGKGLEDAVAVTCTVLLPCPEYLRRAWDEYRWRTRRRIWPILGVLAVLAGAGLLVHRRRVRIA